MKRIFNCMIINFLFYKRILKLKRLTYETYYYINLFFYFIITI